MLMAAPAFAAPTREQVQAWFDAEWKEANEFPSFGHMSIAWRLEEYTALDADEVARLRSEVEGRPEHPRLIDLQRIDERARTGKPTIIGRYQLFWDGDGAWRYCTSYDSVYIDHVQHARQPWRMSDTTLIMLDPERMGKDDEHQTDRQRNVFIPSLGRLLYGGLSAGRISQLVPSPVQIEGDGWSVTLARTAPGSTTTSFEATVRGRWDTDAGRGFVTSWTITSSPRSETVGSGYAIEDWHVDATAGRWIARRAVHRDARGRATRADILESVTLLEHGGIEAYLAPPGPDATDPVRGKVTYTGFSDLRNAPPAPPSTTTPPWTQPPERPGLGWRHAGWGVLSLAVGVLIASIVRRVVKS
jgi:hypothetical protein